MEQFCLECNKAIQGRSDKKFCNDHCRSNYNNEHRNSNTDIVKKVNQILKKNRKILIDLNPDGKTTIYKSELIDCGFNFSLFTSIYETEKKDRYYYCYDMGYLLLGEKMVLLVKKENLSNLKGQKKYADRNSQPAYLNDSE